MHRRLMLMRHAKSSWKVDGVDDHQRPLNKRGAKDAPAVADVLRALGWMPDVVLSSDSARTRQTWERVSARWDPAPPVRFRNDLYLAPLDTFRQLIARQGNDVDTLMILAHNPGCEMTLQWLTGRMYEPMTTANVALMTSDAPTWADAVDRGRQFDLDRVIRPRDPR